MIQPTEKLRASSMVQMIILTLGVPIIFRGDTARSSLSLIGAILTCLPLIPALWLQGKLRQYDHPMIGRLWSIFAALASILWCGLYLNRSAGVFAASLLPYVAEPIFIAGLTGVLLIALLMRPAALGQMAVILNGFVGIVLGILLLVVVRHASPESVLLWQTDDVSRLVPAAGLTLLALLPLCTAQHNPADGEKFCRLSWRLSIVAVYEGLAVWACLGSLGVTLNSQTAVPLAFAMAQQEPLVLLTGNNVLFCCIMLACIMGLLLTGGLTVSANLPSKWPRPLRATLVSAIFFTTAIALRTPYETDPFYTLLGYAGFGLMLVVPALMWIIRAIGHKKTERNKSLRSDTSYKQ